MIKRISRTLLLSKKSKNYTEDSHMIKIFSPVYLVGDIHADTETVIGFIERTKTPEKASYIFLGDIGIFSPSSSLNYKTLDSVLKKKDSKAYFIRGNHDNPKLFKKDAFPKFEKIFLLEDLEEIEILGRKGIVLGGAISIDRILREENVSYWMSEGVLSVVLVPDKEYDFVLAHTGLRPPSESFPFLTRSIPSLFMKKDEALQQDLSQEEENIKKILEKICPKDWYSAHYHTHDIFTYEDTKFTVLDINHIFHLSE